MEWIEVKSSNKYIVFDKYKEGKEKEQQFLVKKGATIYAKVQFVGDSAFIVDKKYLILELVNENFETTGETVSFTPPSYLYVAMGLHPEYSQDRVIAEGDYIFFTYLGRNTAKKGEPYTFSFGYGA